MGYLPIAMVSVSKSRLGQSRFGGDPARAWANYFDRNAMPGIRRKASSIQPTSLTPHSGFSPVNHPAWDKFLEKPEELIDFVFSGRSEQVKFQRQVRLSDLSYSELSPGRNFCSFC